MRFPTQVSGLDEAFSQAEDQIAARNTAAIRAVKDGLLGELRELVEEAGLGARLARTWQGRVYPSGRDSLEPSVYIWSKAPKLIDVFDRGAVIRSSHGWWLAIPTAAAGKTGLAASGKSGRVTPGGFERRTGLRLRLIYRGRLRKPSFLVADNARLSSKGLAKTNSGRTRGGGGFTRLAGRTTVIVFILVPQVSIRKRFDIQQSAQAWAARVPALVAAGGRS